MGKFKFPPVLTLVVVLVGFSLVLLTVLLIQRQTNTRSKASSPTGTAVMCLKPVTGFTTAALPCTNSGVPTTLVGTYDPSNGTVVVKLDLNTINKGIVVWGVQLNIPAANLNQPTVTISSPFTAAPWSPLSFNGVTNSNNQWVLQYGYQMDLTGGATPQTFSLDQTLMTITLPIKPQSPIPANISWTMSFDTTASLAQVADVNSTDILKPPANITVNLTKDTTPPVVSFNASPIENYAPTTNAPVTYTYSATDTVTSPANLKYLAQFDNVTCPSTIASYIGTTSFTTPTLTAGPHTVTACAIDQSGNPGKATRNLTYTVPSARMLLRVKFAGISTDKGPIDAQVIVRPTSKTSPATWEYFDTASGSGSPVVYPQNAAPSAHFTFDTASSDYQADLTNLQLSTGTYDILVKGPSSLRTLVTRSTNGVTLTASAANTVDRTVGTQATVDMDTVRAGDVCKLVCIDGTTNLNTCQTSCVDGQDGFTTFRDLGVVSTRFTSSIVPIYYTDRTSTCPMTTASNPQPVAVPSRIDSNLDCTITFTDLSLINNNFTSSKVEEDQ